MRPGESGVSFLHTADWQIGMRAGHVAAAAEAVRAARLATGQRIVDLARQLQVDFILIAGDLFENNSVGNLLVHQVIRILEQAAPIPVYILPGNHDVLEPGSVYLRDAFRTAPDHIHVLTERKPVPVARGAAWLLPAPVTQKRSERDPTAGLPATPPGAFRIGVAHGSPRIEGKHQTDDHPIARDAARRESLDYLALGHWHSWFELDSRTVMPGTPEPTAFDEESGWVAHVRLRAGEPPQVERVAVRTLEWLWQEAALDAGGAEQAVGALRHWAQGVASPDRTLIRIRCTGPATPAATAALEELEAWLQARFLYAEVDTRDLYPELGTGRLQELAAANPFLGGLLNDLDVLALAVDPLQAGARQAAVARDGAVEGPAPGAPLPVERLRELLAEADAGADVVREAARQLGRLTAEVWR